jgi:hypothetical protein
MAHKRSKKGKQHQHDRQLYDQQKAIVQDYIFTTSFNDKLIREVVEQETVLKADEHLKSQLASDVPQVYYPCNDGWQDGLVLVGQLEYAIYQNMILYPTQMRYITESQ